MTPTQSRMALAALRWTLDELAASSGVPRITVARYQTGKPVAAASVSAMKIAFKLAGVKFDRRSARLIVSVPE